MDCISYEGDPIFRTEVRESMRVDWDVPIEMDDGIILRANLYRPDDGGNYPVCLLYTSPSPRD